MISLISPSLSLLLTLCVPSILISQLFFLVLLVPLSSYLLLFIFYSPPSPPWGSIAVLQGYAGEVESHRHSRDTPSSFSGHMGAGLGPRHYTVHLRAVLLLQFMEHLDKLMYNAYEGSCVTLPPVPKVTMATVYKMHVRDVI